MDRTICDRCPWAKEEKAHGGWYYMACYHEPYRGAWVKQIDCPKEKEGGQNVENFAEKFKAARRAAGMNTQQDVADWLDVSKRAIEEWERGTRVPPPYAQRLLLEKLDSMKKETE